MVPVVVVCSIIVSVIAIDEHACIAYPGSGVTNNGDIEKATKQPNATACIQRCESLERCCLGLWNPTNSECYLKDEGYVLPGRGGKATAFNCTGCSAHAPTSPPTPPAPAPPPLPPTPAPAAVPNWPVTYNASLSTATMACNYTGMLNLSLFGQFGLVDIDWSNAKEVWANNQPMNADAMLSEQAKVLKSTACPVQCPASSGGCKARGSCPSKVMVYRNLVKALPWFGSVREKLADPQYSGFFVRFGGPATSNGSVPGAHVPACDSNFQPSRCSQANLYHDQSQTPQYPRGSLLDGSCSVPCDCGTGVPCGEYVFDHRNGSMLRQWLLDEYIGGGLGLGDPNVDGFLLDDAWMPQYTRHRDNVTVPGGPSEYERHAVADMGLSQTEVAHMYREWQYTTTSVEERVVQSGGWLYHRLQDEGCGTQACCSSFLRAACTNASTQQQRTSLYRWTKPPQPNPTPSQLQAQRSMDLSMFLLSRGPYAWLGYGWGGTCDAPTPYFASLLERDYGAPTGLCAETVPGQSGVFVREWSKATVTVDCGKWQSDIHMKD